ncbi:hypothetical protein BT69DRAFT_1292352 [Atractiella rhizophila]|nr:hypothetical protein BT69DRAFT_1292352 [Atractiella rhizophila]
MYQQNQSPTSGYHKGQEMEIDMGNGSKKTFPQTYSVFHAPGSSGLRPFLLATVEWEPSTRLDLPPQQDTANDNAGPASKFKEYGDTVRTLQVGMMKIRAEALQAGKMFSNDLKG